MWYSHLIGLDISDTVNATVERIEEDIAGRDLNVLQD